MTDKQIIIDVSKCKECGLRNCEGNLIYWCHTYDDHCKDFDNCYYKQLKRAEKTMQEIWDRLGKTSDELLSKEQECEELKEKVKKYGEINEQETKDYAELKAENDNIKETFDGLFKVQYKLADSCKKLRQCLTEIKEIAEKIANYYDGDEYELMRKDAEQILQKISECEGNDETN